LFVYVAAILTAAAAACHRSRHPTVANPSRRFGKMIRRKILLDRIPRAHGAAVPPARCKSLAPAHKKQRNTRDLPG